MVFVTEKNKTNSKSRSSIRIRTRLTVSCVKLVAHITPYVEPEILGLKKLIKDGDVCIDVGAAAGLYTVVLSKLVGPSGRVLSIEPLVFAHPGLSRLLGTRSYHNVTNYCFAIGSKSGKSSISVPIGKFGPITGRSFLTNGASGLGSNSEFGRHKDVEVQVDTLDEFCQREHLERLDFIKIDVEGAEKQVFQGALKTIGRFKPAILVEIEDRHLKRFGYKSQDIVEDLTKRGYQMYKWSHGWKKTNRVEASNRNYLFLNNGDEA
jgi:FkbM family methyltransferase